MFRLDKAAQDALLKIYSQFKSSSDITVSAPEYEQTTIDYLISCGLLEKLNASTLSGWAYIVKPTYEGKSAYNEPLKMPLSKINDFISQGEIIMQEEYHHVTSSKSAALDYISGPKSDQWFSEISIFNNRTLANHPLHDQIENVCKKHRKLSSPHEEMMGYLNAIAGDEEFWRETAIKEEPAMYDVFISHASKDKLDYVDNLKNSLDKLRINVFYDKDTIEWGDMWKDKILEGVAKAEFAIIVISENFFGREWTELELNEFLHRQNSNGQKIILPILYNINDAQLRERYPDVADIQALKGKDHSCDEIALLFAGQLIKRLKAK